VRDIVDAAGGVEIDVDAPIHDDAYPTDDYRTIVVDIPAGRQRMDGETALRYARTRHQDSDFGRIARQQRVLLALRNRMLQPGNWWHMPAVLDAVRRTTRTDLGPLDLVGLGVSLIGSPTEPERLAIGPPLVEPFSGTDDAYLLRPTPAVRRSVAVLLAPSEATVEVLNATPSAGLAKRAADTLRGRGLQAVRYGDAGRSQPTTTVEVRPGAGRAGRQVAASLDLPPALVSESAGLPDDLDVRVTLGDRS
jgi:polyisoprenyl-teichoic acid--peptidoglycan teichoic acid transferase